mmetsp:Transcript_42957/g.98647  ORF Transcript_42957/g.98647 Transcript_42957/m.98647 type:complete len:577 (-) Transcript_42957:126-1856(-)
MGRGRWAFHSALAGAVCILFATLADSAICQEEVVQLIDMVDRQGIGAASSADLPVTCACTLDSGTGYTALHELGARGCSSCDALVQLMVQGCHASTLALDPRGATPLHVAAAHGSVSVASALCDVAASRQELTSLLAAIDVQGKTALDAAEEAGQVEIARELVDRGALRGDVSPTYSSSNPSCEWAMVDAVLLTDAALLRSVISAANRAQAAACLVPPTNRRQSLLHVAAAVSGLVSDPIGIEIVQSVLDHGGDVLAVDFSGEAPLARAARAKSLTGVSLILDQGIADANAQDSKGCTALHRAAQAGSRKCTIELLARGASPTLVDSKGLTALEYAQQAGHDAVVDGIETFTSQGAGNVQVQLQSATAEEAEEERFRRGSGAGNNSNVAIAMVATTVAVMTCACTALVCTLIFRKLSGKAEEDKPHRVIAWGESRRPESPKGMLSDVADAKVEDADRVLEVFSQSTASSQDHDGSNLRFAGQGGWHGDVSPPLAINMAPRFPVPPSAQGAESPKDRFIAGLQSRVRREPSLSMPGSAASSQLTFPPEGRREGHTPSTTSIQSSRSGQSERFGATLM